VQPVDAIQVPAWCVRLVSELDAADACAIAVAKDLSVEQLNWHPRRGAWSIGQCLEHLSLSNEVYIEPIADSLRAQPTGPVNEITPGWFARWFIRSYIEPTTQRMRGRAPQKAAPVAKRLDTSIVDRFIASNAVVRGVIARARDFDVNRVRFRNPYVPVIRFTIGTGLHIMARHNHRHLLQAKRVRESPGFPRE
jgi:hypothetical protein